MQVDQNILRRICKVLVLLFVYTSTFSSTMFIFIVHSSLTLEESKITKQDPTKLAPLK